MTSHYETLGIPKEASAERIKRSYRKLVKLYHPDQFPSRSREQAEAEKRMRDINVAYSVLSKPLSRMRYDAKLNERAFFRIQVDPEHCSRCGKLTGHWQRDRKSTRLNSSHRCISYAVFCLKKKIQTPDFLLWSSREHRSRWRGRATR